MGSAARGACGIESRGREEEHLDYQLWSFINSQMIFLALKWNNFGFTSIGGKIVIGKSNKETFIKQIQTPMDIKEEIQIQIQTCTDWMVNFEKRNQESSPVTAFSKCKGCQQFPNDLFSFHGLQSAFAFFWCCVSLSFSS